MRHAYTAPLDATRMRQLATEWQEARPLLTADLDDFERFLDGLTSQLDAE